MLIISDFKDFYDHAAAHGVDKSVVYRREPDYSTHEMKSYSDYSHSPTIFWSLGGKTVRVSPRVLVIAGTPYPFYYGHGRSSFDPMFYEGSFIKMFSKGQIPTNEELGREIGIHTRKWDMWNDLAKSPVVILSEDKRWGGEATIYVEANPCLRDYQAHRHLDAQTTHQEIMMWLSREPVIEMEPLSEKVQVQRHGLHPTKAFRK